MAQKKGLAEIRKEKIPNPKVIVNGCIVAGTKITGPNADVRLKWDHSNCIKSKIIRAGLHLLNVMSNKDLARALGQIEKLKTGRK